MNFLTPEQVANILQVSKMTVYREIKRGKLKSYKFGKELRIRNSDFEAYLQDAYQAAQKSMVSQHSCIAPIKPKTAIRGKMTQQTASRKSVRAKSRTVRIKTPNKKVVKRTTKPRKRSR